MWQSSQRFLPNQPIDTPPTHQSSIHDERVKTSLHAKKSIPSSTASTGPFHLSLLLIFRKYYQSDLSFSTFQISSEEVPWDSVNFCLRFYKNFLKVFTYFFTSQLLCYDNWSNQLMGVNKIPHSLYVLLEWERRDYKHQNSNQEQDFGKASRG